MLVVSSDVVLTEVFCFWMLGPQLWFAMNVFIWSRLVFRGCDEFSCLFFDVNVG
jgi:hypothetical protein